jgi:hypothetical protein
LMKGLITIILGLAIIAGCSDHKPNTPSGPPPAPRKGTVSLVNNSGVSIRLVGYTQTRGIRREQVQLNSHLFASQTFYLHNLIDPDQDRIFPGGDRVAVQYYSEIPDPSNPSQPLFRETVELTIDGNAIIQVKSGGEFDISPG